VESISVGAGAYDVNLDTGMVYLAPALVEVLDLPEYGRSANSPTLSIPTTVPITSHDIRALQGRDPALDIEFRYRGREGTWRWRASTASWCVGRWAWAVWSA